MSHSGESVPEKELRGYFITALTTLALTSALHWSEEPDVKFNFDTQTKAAAKEGRLTDAHMCFEFAHATKKMANHLSDMAAGDTKNPYFVIDPRECLELVNRRQERAGLSGPVSRP